MLRRNALLTVAGLAVMVTLTACTQAPAPQSIASSGQSAVAAPSTGGTSSSSAPASPSASPTPTPSPTAAVKKVHVSLLEGDGASYGVGMPIIAFFDRAPTNAHAFAAATKVTVNGKAAQGGWYFESTAHAGAAMEAHYRLENYWPAHSTITVDLPVKGLSAGKGLAFDDSLTLSIATGRRNMLTVNSATLKMTVESDGKVYGTFPVSLGAANTPTARGTKVIMEKGADISMRGPGYYDPHVQWTQRLTYGGEYLHSAPWNVANLGVRSTSNGCTNLAPAVAKQLYGYLQIGDVVKFPNANGPQMRLGDGYGDWNLSWAQWAGGGALKTA
ncbi:L,D-transpeptidase [Jatrophihabitans telluris]|uniref:L,D-transpeptidase n=1 Tax=Jatrophihabitans telluris TaxID=2038343 RepID=A0ABY4R4I0_9ACTN|nr:L,D-transpeptidase [Jatrophihabitans telluris]UQX89976.1 L,D-transpeptidase [Jatrophihabitans telluris]